MTRHVRHALTSWIACLALLFAALAPGLSHAFLRAAPQVADFPICSAAGHAAPAQGKFDFGADPYQHCPYCTDHHHMPGLPPPGAAALLSIGGPLLPALFHAAPAPLFHWAAPLSRAPPAIS